jgi:hypothetical protein
LVEPVSIAIRTCWNFQREASPLLISEALKLSEASPKITSQLEMQGGAAVAKASTSPAE